MISAEYLAGFFDGEGCVTTGAGARNLIVGISQRQAEILKEIQEQFGGSVYLKPDGVSLYIVTQKKAATLLEFILPHLRLKKTIAEMGITLGRRPDMRGRSRNEGYLMEKVIREKLHLLIREQTGLTTAGSRNGGRRGGLPAEPPLDPT